MCNQKEEVKVNHVHIDIDALREEASRTRRMEAKAEMLKALPAIISSFAPIVESIAKVQTSRHETLGSRLVDVELDLASRGDNIIETMIDLGKEFGIFDNIQRLMESETDLQIAINQKEIADLNKIDDNDDDNDDADDDDDNDDDSDDVIDDKDDVIDDDDDDDYEVPDRRFKPDIKGCCC